jgi:acetolactate synthase-1/2/3 large subunit
MLEALQEAGIAYIFANFGSDHPALIEAIAEARASGRPIPPSSRVRMKWSP